MHVAQCSFQHFFTIIRTKTNLDNILKSRNYFANKGPPSQNYGFSIRYVWMLELDYKKSWAPKNWCFWTVVLEKTLESPLDFKEIKPVNPKGNQPWILIGRTDAEAPLLWPPDGKNYFQYSNGHADTENNREQSVDTVWVGRVGRIERVAWRHIHWWWWFSC